MTSVATSETPVGGSVHQLGDASFRVSIVTDTPAEPGSLLGLRFDHTAFVESARLNGRQFLASHGLVDEFGILGVGVLGYASAQPGDPFIKIGVGTLERANADAYHTGIDFPRIASFPVQVDRQGNTLAVTQRSNEVRGYAYQLDKTYRVESTSGQITITYALTNIGQASFSFEHYNHNFLGFDGKPLDSNVTITLGRPLPSVPHSWLVSDEERLTIVGTPGVNSFIQVNHPLAADEADVQVEHAGKQMRVQITGDYPAYRAAYFFAPESFSPERFYRTRLDPGETVEWTSRYTFEAPGATD